MTSLAQFTGARPKSIQRGTISLGAGVTSLAATITSVDTSKSELRYLGVNGNAAAVTDVICRLTLTSATQVTADRSASGNSAVVGFEVTEFY